MMTLARLTGADRTCSTDLSKKSTNALANFRKLKYGLPLLNPKVCRLLSKYVNFRGAAPNFRKVSDSPEVQRIQTRERDGGRKQRYGTILNAARCLPFRRETALQNWCIWVLSWRRRRRRLAADDDGGVAVACVGIGRLHLPRDASKQCARHLPRGGDHRLSLLSLMVMMLFSRGTASIWSSVPHIIAKARRRRIDASGGSLHRYGGLDRGM
jgi:hypothetical protein